MFLEISLYVHYNYESTNSVRSPITKYKETHFSLAYLTDTYTVKNAVDRSNVE